MNHEVQDNDDVLFDRLADGELSSDERKLLLASLDDRPDGWRRCALAFLEAQTWGGAMRQIVREPLTKQLALPERPLTSVIAPSKAKSRGTKLAASSTWLATAAAVLVAFGLGWQLNDADAPTDADLVVDAAAPQAAPAIAAPLPAGDAITLVVRDEQGQPQRVQVPLVEGRRLGEQFGESPQWAAPEVRRRLAEQGLDLQARRRYAPLFFEQKNGIVPMIVPVDDAVVTPVSRPIY